MLNVIEKLLYLLVDALAQTYLFLRQLFYPTEFNPEQKVKNKAVLYVHGLFGFKQQFSPLHEASFHEYDPYALDVVFNMEDDIKALSNLYHSVHEKKYDSVVMVGHSRGCILIAKFFEALESKRPEAVLLAPATKDAYLVELYKYVNVNHPRLEAWIVMPMIKMLGLKRILDEFLCLETSQAISSKKFYAAYEAIGKPGVKSEFETNIKATHMSILASHSAYSSVSSCITSRKAC